MAILLRTLTEKSTLGFGRHANMKVGDLLKRRSLKNYLIWVYYNCSMINFSESVLESLWIHTEYRIEKPGVCKGKEIEITERATKFYIAKTIDTISGNAGYCYMARQKKSKKRSVVRRQMSRIIAQNKKSVLREANRKFQ